MAPHVQLIVKYVQLTGYKIMVLKRTMIQCSAYSETTALDSQNQKVDFLFNIIYEMRYNWHSLVAKYDNKSFSIKFLNERKT